MAFEAPAKGTWARRLAGDGRSTMTRTGAWVKVSGEPDEGRWLASRSSESGRGAGDSVRWRKLSDQGRKPERRRGSNAISVWRKRCETEDEERWKESERTRRETREGRERGEMSETGEPKPKRYRGLTFSIKAGRQAGGFGMTRWPFRAILYRDCPSAGLDVRVCVGGGYQEIRGRESSLDDQEAEPEA